MVTLTCKCGSQTVTFKNLSHKDFPHGLQVECCEKALADAPRIEAGSPEATLGHSEAVIEPVAEESSEPKKWKRKGKA